ncbi:MAG: sigma 54-interacting transcriptional regulator [Planctomycetota bacterium]|nr:sigma 54-interacting transcriptional regulator [Planctomycetota bacterium]
MDEIPEIPAQQAVVSAAGSGQSTVAQRQLAFERLLADLTTSLANLATDRVDEEIDRGLRAIAEFVGVDRSMLMEFSPDGRQLRRIHGYAGAGIEPVPEIVASEQFPWYAQQLRQGVTLVLRCLPDDLPAEASRCFCVEQGLKSHLAIPLQIGDAIVAVLAFGTLTRFVDWPDELVSRLRLLGGVLADALARRRADVALRANEERFRTLPDFTYDWEYWLAPDGRMVYVSPSCERITGYRCEAFVADASLLERIIHAEDRAQFVEHLRSEATSGPQAMDLRIVTRSGELRWISHLCQAVFGSQGEYLGRRASNRDITDGKRNQLALEQAYAEIRQLQEHLQDEIVYLRSQVEPVSLPDGIVGQSSSLTKVLRQVEQVAKTNATVLLTGETGTGKELIATAIHELSGRRVHMMVRVNCAALPPTLIESELFGREKGAYTGALTKQVGRFELAHGSTIFLDEVGELPLELQAKLLRVLQEGTFERVGSPKTIKVDLRVIAASNRDLTQTTGAGRFREDLFYRLNVFPIHLPPLRERSEDIPALVETFVEEFARALGKTIRSIPRSVIDALQRYPWPGNVRELRNLIERAVIISEGTTLHVDLPTPSSLTSPRGATLEEVERNHILTVLEQTGWRIRGPGGAAETLGIKPTTLESRLGKLGIRRRSGPLAKDPDANHG